MHIEGFCWWSLKSFLTVKFYEHNPKALGLTGGLFKFRAWRKSLAPNLPLFFQLILAIACPLAWISDSSCCIWLSPFTSCPLPWHVGFWCSPLSFSLEVMLPRIYLTYPGFSCFPQACCQYSSHLYPWPNLTSTLEVLSWFRPSSDLQNHMLTALWSGRSFCFTSCDFIPFNGFYFLWNDSQILKFSVQAFVSQTFSRTSIQVASRHGRK